MATASNDAVTLGMRPQVGIDRLPTRRPSHESKQAMNCKSCRKRKIKCSRVLPSCEACRVFKCACVYDAMPKKRGPKTDMLDALVKRVSGLEKRLQDETKAETTGVDETDCSPEEISQPDSLPTSSVSRHSIVSQSAGTASEPAPWQGPAQPSQQSYLTRETIAFTDALLDTYFARLHDKPFYILDEANTRQRLRDGQLPHFTINAIHAVSIRFVPHLCGGHSGAVKASQEYAYQARLGIDVDEPSIDHLQALLLLTIANFQAGRGKKSHMLLSHAISMAFTLDLHREVPAHLRVASIEREGRRRLFWTCYLMDRFDTSGTSRPTLIADQSIALQYPAATATGPQHGERGISFPHTSAGDRYSPNSSPLRGVAANLVEIVRILGVTNKYLVSGGVKSDSHFPWHPQSTLSKIRADLDRWAAGTQELSSSIDRLFAHRDGAGFALSKLIYHTIHCLLYRPLLPMDLVELSGNSQNQSWQIDATHICFVHANSIVELVDAGKRAGILYWPSFTAYCISTAGTIHIHGAHYAFSAGSGESFANSAHFLDREMNQLADLAFIWGGVGHQREALQACFASHSNLAQSIASSSNRFSPVFQMEDFFDRYAGTDFDSAHVSFRDFHLDRNLDGLQSIQRPMQARFGPISTHGGLLQQLDGFTGKEGDASCSVQQEGKRRKLNDPSPYPTPTVEFQPDPFDNTAASSHGHDSDRIRASREEATNDSSLPTAFFPSFGLSPLTQGVPQQDARVESEISSPARMENNMTMSTFAFMDQSQPAPAANNDHMYTPGHSGSEQSSHQHTVEPDPFLSFLEQLAETEYTNGEGGMDLMQVHDSPFAFTPPPQQSNPNGSIS